MRKVCESLCDGIELSSLFDLQLPRTQREGVVKDLQKVSFPPIAEDKSAEGGQSGRAVRWKRSERNSCRLKKKHNCKYFLTPAPSELSNVSLK